MEKEIRMVRKIASDVRKWIKNTYMGRYFYRDDLAGFCAIASFHLFKELQAAGFDCYFVENESRNHAFVLWGENVIDITATQFSWERDYPEVLIESIGTLSKYWKIGKKAKTDSEIKKLVWAWPKHQQPTIAA